MRDLEEECDSWYKAGRTDGYHEGSAVGYAEGVKDGKAAALRTWDEGYWDGQEDGFKRGYDTAVEFFTGKGLFDLGDEFNKWEEDHADHLARGAKAGPSHDS